MASRNATKSPLFNCSVDVDQKEFRHDDLRELSNIFAKEFNNGDLHDRILVFQIENEGKQQNSEVESIQQSEAEEERELSDLFSSTLNEKSNPVRENEIDKTGVLIPAKLCSSTSNEAAVEKTEQENGNKDMASNEIKQVSTLESPDTEIHDNNLTTKSKEQPTNKHKIFVHSCCLLYKVHISELYFITVKHQKAYTQKKLL